VDALPGVHEVPLAMPGTIGMNARLGLGYGWTEAVLKMGDSHQRLQLDVAGSFSPLAWLSAAVWVRGRYDTHSGADDDDGVVAETRLAIRATQPLGAGFYAGIELAPWLPGGDTVGGALSALSSDLQLLLVYAPELSPLTLGLAIGARMDRSKHAGGDPHTYSAADRLALGASDSVWALRQGVALSYRTGVFEWVAEWSWKMYFDYVAESPMWVRAGLRWRPLPPVQLELLLGVSPSQRPSLDADAPLAVVEPRLAGGLSATYRWSMEPPQPRAEAAPIPPLPPPAADVPIQLRGLVRSSAGTGIADASLTLRQGDATHAATSDTQGKYAFAAVPVGQYTMQVAADGYTNFERVVELRRGETPELQITLERELPQGQIRVTVRRFDAKPVVATVAIAERKVSRPTREDGTLEVDVPPGDYKVTITARGFRPQTRTARVDMHGVAILVVELEAAQ
jgi:hypothetical protein